MVHYRAMKLSDYGAIHKLLSATPGVTVRDADSHDATARYLKRNPGLSFVAIENKHVIGCIMCGQDGRRGYLQHLVVSSGYRGQGIAKTLVTLCIQALEQQGIEKSHVEVQVTNARAQAFWPRLGRTLRDDIRRYSFVSSGNAGA